ncbi:MAG: MATE family efflux transporter [Hydrogenoanaerobacterium sp.]
MTEKQFITLPVKKVFAGLALPSIFSMVFSSIYMMSDGIFVGRFIGEHALAAVNLIMPVAMIIFALSDMIAVGSSVKVSTALGEGNIEKAKHLFSASVLMIIGLGFVFSVLGLFFIKPLIFSLIKDKMLAEMAYSYARVFTLAFPFIMPLFAMDNFLRACGQAKYGMWLNIIVSVLNIALDWFFIAHLGLGIEFSAISSVISMFLGVIFCFAPFFTGKLTLHFSKPKISLHEVIGIIHNGASEFFSSIAGSFIATVINVILLNLGGAVAIASHGIVMYIDTLLISILYGILDSIQPAVSYNLGAKESKRMFLFFKISCVFTAALSVLCMTFILLFPEFLVSIFSKDNNNEIINMTVIALLLFAPSYLFTWFNMVTSAFLTAMDKPKESMLIMMFRAIIFPILCLLLLTSFMGVYGVFLTATISGALTAVVALIIWVKASKKIQTAV